MKMPFGTLDSSFFFFGGEGMCCETNDVCVCVKVCVCVCVCLRSRESNRERESKRQTTAGQKEKREGKSEGWREGKSACIQGLGFSFRV